MTLKKVREWLKGMMVVQYCPYTLDDQVDLEGLRLNTKYIVEFASAADRDVVIITNGSTAECYANSFEEQQAIISTVAECSGDVPVIAGVSQAGTKETVRLARFAEKAGTDCVMVVPPFYAPTTTQGLYEHFKQVADAISIPVMIYNNPDASKVLLDPSFIKKLASIENIVAIKDNAPHTFHYAQMAFEIDPEELILICGLGEYAYVGAAAYGRCYRGFATFIANFAPELAYSVYTAVNARDFQTAFAALRKQWPLWKFIADSMKNRATLSVLPTVLRGNAMCTSVGKAAMDLVGLRGGKPRLPLTELTQEEKERLRSILRMMGVQCKASTRRHLE